MDESASRSGNTITAVDAEGETFTVELNPAAYGGDGEVTMTISNGDGDYRRVYFSKELAAIVTGEMATILG